MDWTGMVSLSAVAFMFLLAIIVEHRNQKKQEKEIEINLDKLFEVLRSWLTDEISDAEAKRKIYKLYNSSDGTVEEEM